jgi:hypothetical protein
MLIFEMFLNFKINIINAPSIDLKKSNITVILNNLRFCIFVYIILKLITKRSQI